MKLTKTKMLIMMLLVSQILFASNGETQGFSFEQIIIIVLLCIIILVIFAIVGLAVRVIKKLGDAQRDITLHLKGLELPEPKPRKSIFASWTKAVDIDKEADIDLGHDYDGIRELDNVLPPWWVAMFYGTIIFAAFYSFYYTTDNDQYFEYKNEIAAEKLRIEKYYASAGEPVNENTVTYLDDEKSLAAGKKIFMTNCTPCHGHFAQGQQTYPNLTDAYWLHGGGIKNIFKTVKLGVPGTGMVSWKSALNATQINRVASYVWSLQGSNPSNAKAPQGEKWEEPAKE